MGRVVLSHPEKVLFPADGITKADLADYYEAVAPVMVPHVRNRPLNLWRWNAGIERQRVVQQEIPKGAPEWVHRVTRAAPARRRRHPRDGRRRRHAALAVAGQLHHPARVDQPRRPARPARPHDLRPRPARRGRRLRPHPRGRAGDGRAAARARARALRDDERLARHPRRRAAAPHRGPRRRARAGARDRRGAGEAPPRPAHHGVAQGQARGPDPDRHRAQHLRADHGRALCGARAAGRPGRHAAALGGARGPADCARTRSRSPRRPRGSSATATPGRRSGTVKIRRRRRSCSDGGASTAIRSRPSGRASSRSSATTTTAPAGAAPRPASGPGGSCGRSSPRR